MPTNLIVSIEKWLDNKCSLKHDRLKEKIRILQELRGLAYLNNAPLPELERYDKKLRKLRKKLGNGLQI